MWREIHYALRLLGKTPGFTALTVFVLAAGLCVAVYMFAFIRTLGYAELPYPNSERLMMVGSVIDGREESGNTINSFDFQQFAAEQTHFEIFIQARTRDATLSGGELPKLLNATYSKNQLFDITAVPPLLGRVLQPADMATGAPAVAVLSHAIWQSEFNAEPDIVGRTVKIDDQLTTVVGVMPAGFAFPNWTDVWLPLREPGALQAGEGPTADIIGMLRPEATRELAEGQLKAIAKRLEQQHPLTNANRNVVIWPYVQQHIASGGMSVLKVMGIAAAFLFLLVLLNAGNLLLARAAERQKEIAIRAALGAPRLRLVRQMLWQALLLALFGGLIGLFFASWGLRWNNLQLASFITYLPFWWHFELSLSDLLFGLGLMLLSSVAVGLYPALRASGGDLNQFLRDGTRGAQSLRMARLTHVLVVAEIALSVALLIVALALAIATRNLVTADYHARIDNVLVGEVVLYKQQYQTTPLAPLQLAERLHANLAAQPDVQAVAIASHMPGMLGPTASYRTEGSDILGDSLPNAGYPRAQRITVSADYFRLFDIPLIDGRAFDQRDTVDSEPVVIVSQAFAEKNWPGQSALGKRIELGHEQNEARWFTVIGVVGNTLFRQPDMAHPDYAAVYLTQRQSPMMQPVIAVATANEPMVLARTLATEVARLDADLPVHKVMPLADRIYRYTGNAGRVWITKQFLAMAALGVLLAASGIYGVIARSVALRTQELGVRRALGASERRILLLLIQQGGYRFLLGGSIGVMLGLLMMQAVRAAMFGIDRGEGLIAAAVLLLVGGIVALATLLPARRAITLTPAAALRHE